jgi:parallel beta helix pectate lyase-like protein
VDSYITDFQEIGIDSQGLWAHNTTGPLQIRNNYIEAATENVLFGGLDSRAPDLVPADIEISNNYFFKPLSLLSRKYPNNYPMKNLLELKAAQRVVVTGNTFENNPSQAQQGFAILITPRNQNGTAPWSVTTDIAITGNVLINVGSGFAIMGRDDSHPSLLTERILIRNNVVGVTGLNGADGRAFQVTNGGSDYTIDHNTIINTAGPPVSVSCCPDLMMAATRGSKVTGFTFTNNLATHSKYGFFGAGGADGTAALNANFTNWVFIKNVIVGAGAPSYPASNFFPATVAAVKFVNYPGGDFTLAADSPYKFAATDGTAIGANMSAVPAAKMVAPNPPSGVAVR